MVGASKQARPAQVKMSLGASANNGVVGFSMKGNATPLKAESHGSSMMSMATKVSQTPRSGNLQMKMSAMPSSSQSSGFGSSSSFMGNDFSAQSKMNTRVTTPTMMLGG